MTHNVKTNLPSNPRYEMKTPKTLKVHLLLYLFCLSVSAQTTDSIVQKLSQYAYLIDNFSKYIPQEKVYMQFDNTSYYQGDNIWFKCFLVTSDLHPATDLSKDRKSVV